MKKVVGYGIAVIGLVVMVLGSGFFIKIDLGIDSMYVTGVGVVLVVVGALMSTMGSKKVKKQTEEVPIYEGTGKNRRIVGYRRD